ncbi:hypothetical protein GG344DRAFT_78302 [Lentinula edodes]|nr:hypothetical protein GG344DRAFT_78302 [Lentinula edodes]
MSQPYLYLPFVQRILFEQWDINITEGVPLNAIAGQRSVGEGYEASADAEDFKAEDFLEGDEDPDLQNNYPEDLDEVFSVIIGPESMRIYTEASAHDDDGDNGEPVMIIDEPRHDLKKHHDVPGPLDEGSTFNVYAHGSKPKIDITVISPPHSSTSLRRPPLIPLLTTMMIVVVVPPPLISEWFLTLAASSSTTRLQSHSSNPATSNSQQWSCLVL